MKVLLVLLITGLIIAAFIWFINKMIEWSDSSSEVKSNIGCWVLGLFFFAVFIIATLGSIKSCIH